MEGVAVIREVKEGPQQRLAKGPSLAKLSAGGVGNDRINSGWRTQADSPRTGYVHRSTGSLPRQVSRSTRGLRSEMTVYGDKFRRREAKKEILRRALTPPAKRPTLRWLDFRPTPSRLCNMSTAWFSERVCIVPRYFISDFGRFLSITDFWPFFLALSFLVICLIFANFPY